MAEQQQEVWELNEEYRRNASRIQDSKNKISEFNTGKADNGWKVGMGLLGGVFSVDKRSAKMAKPLLAVIDFLHEAYKNVGKTSDLDKIHKDALVAQEDFFKRHPEYRDGAQPLPKQAQATETLDNNKDIKSDIDVKDAFMAVSPGEKASPSPGGARSPRPASPVAAMIENGLHAPA